MFCKYCGKELPGDALYCLQCGKPQHEKSMRREIVQFLKFAVYSNAIMLRSNDQQTVQHAFNLLKPVVKLPEKLCVTMEDNAWSLSYENRKFFNSGEPLVIKKGELIHENT